MANEYSTAAEIEAFAGTWGVDLRTDDVGGVSVVDDAITFAGADFDFFCQGRYLSSDLTAIQWVRNVATAFAVEWLCLRRLNSVPEGLAKQCDRYREQLALVLEGKAQVPGAARSRRPVTVTNQVVDLRRRNNNVRVDRTRSTGVAQDYVRPSDPTAPDDR